MSISARGLAGEGLKSRPYSWRGWIEGEITFEDSSRLGRRPDLRKIEDRLLQGGIRRQRPLPEFPGFVQAPG